MPRNKTCDGPGAANTGADEESAKGSGRGEGSAPVVVWTDAEVLAWIAAVRHIARYTHRDVRWALPREVRARIAA